MKKISEQSEIEKLKDEIERLKKELKKRKKYGLVWEEKPEEVVEMCKEKLPVLKEVKDKEIITDKNKPVNLLIEGDNYHALSVLNYTHAGKVDVIYIDPPYNTGNKDFIFNDHYVDREDTYCHSKWLSFMEKRLKLAKNLLKDTGVIFISIDDNEVAQLKLLMDELFNNNFIANIVWRKRAGGGNDSKYIAIDHEYILVYSKSKNPKFYTLPLSEKQLKNYRYKDEKFKTHGPYALKPLHEPTLQDSKGLHFDIKCPDGSLLKGSDHQWKCNKETFLKRLKENRIVFKKDKNNNWKVYYKIYLNERRGELIFDENRNIIQRERLPLSILYNLALNSEGGKELKEIFNVRTSKEVFSNPKPVELIKHLLSFTTDKNSIILDFFAGSGTTGHAVLELNKEDNGKRKFILCTNNENNNGNDYKIAEDVCYPRIKKVVEGYKNLKGEQVEGLGGNLKYFRTDFVDAEPSDKNKIKLTHQATEMLCIKEGTFEKVIDNERFKIFKNSDNYTGIIWDQTAIPEFKKAIKDIKGTPPHQKFGGGGKFSVYVFSLGDETFDEEFTNIKQKVKLSPIPEAILKVYRGIFK